MRAVFSLAVWRVAATAILLAGPALAGSAERPEERPQPVPHEDYPLYDRVVRDKFLTSQTSLVLVERLTVTKLGPEWPPTSVALFADSGFFEGRLPSDLVLDFVMKNRRPSRLEARFNFGVKYRLVSGQGEEPEVSLAPIPAVFAYSSGRGGRAMHHSRVHVGRTQAVPATVGILEFSRAGFSRLGDQALVYVGDNRGDGTGAGFLLWLQRNGQAWEVADTDVLWIARPDEER